MERWYRTKMSRKPGGGLKDMPQCERCGRPIRVRSDDYTREELLCANCASETLTSDFDYGFDSRDLSR